MTDGGGGFQVYASGWGCCLCLLVVGAIVFGAFKLGQRRRD
jgi:hypothetical protein